MDGVMLCNPDSHTRRLNADGTCNMKNIYQLIRHYTCSHGQLCYVPNYDINCDGTTNMKDIYIAIRHYGQTDQ